MTNEVKPKLLIIYLLIVVLPLALVAWLGWRLNRDEQAMVQQRFRDLLTGQLQDLDASLATLMASRERDVARRLETVPSAPAAARELVRTQPRLRQVFFLDAKGRRVHPAAPFSAAEQEFLDRTRQVWKDQQVFYRSGEGAADHGWYTWFHGSDVNFIYWRHDAAGNVAGAELDRVRLLADIVAQLPERSPPGTRITLVDSAGKIVYEYGDSPATTPHATLALSAPLQSWRLNCFAAATDLTGRTVWTLLVGVFALGLALTGLAIYFYRESTRELRDAAQRVSFVNQVSHELKTPLTNIRLYAELLEQSLSEPNDALAHNPHPPTNVANLWNDRSMNKPHSARRHVSVIVSESQRLSRLIANVLRFAKPRTLHKTTGSVDEIIHSVIEDFTPALTAKGLAIHFTPGSPTPINFDADALEQIIANLISNVEKYAATGKQLTITTQQTADSTLIIVADQGPGVPADQRENIFKPFHRLSNKLTDGVTGTGIGLTIARDLARQHGGDLALLPTPTGATFQLRLPKS